MSGWRSYVYGTDRQEINVMGSRREDLSRGLGFGRESVEDGAAKERKWSVGITPR